MNNNRERWASRKRFENSLMLRVNEYRIGFSMCFLLLLLFFFIFLSCPLTNCLPKILVQLEKTTRGSFVYLFLYNFESSQGGRYFLFSFSVSVKIGEIIEIRYTKMVSVVLMAI